MTSISILDLGLGVLALLFVVRGLMRGLIHEVAGLAGIFLGIFLAGRFYPLIAPQFQGIIDSQKLASVIAYGVIFALTLILVALAATVLRRFMTFTLTAWLDNLLGAVVGFAKGVLICAIALALLQRFAPDSPFLRNAILPEYIDAVVAFARGLFPDFLQTARDAVSGMAI